MGQSFNVHPLFASPQIVEEVISKYLNGKKIQEITEASPETNQKILVEVEERLDEEYQKI